MSEFKNTIDIIGDDVAARMLVDRTILEYNDDTMTSIAGNAFYYCSALKSVYLPNVTIIGNQAFRFCTALTSVRLPATPPTLTSSYAFNKINSACVFYIPTGSLGAYQSATNWSSLTSQYSFEEEDRT